MRNSNVESLSGAGRCLCVWPNLRGRICTGTGNRWKDVRGVTKASSRTRRNSFHQSNERTVTAGAPKNGHASDRGVFVRGEEVYRFRLRWIGSNVKLGSLI